MTLREELVRRFAQRGPSARDHGRPAKRNPVTPV